MSVSSCTVLIYFFCHDTKINNRSEFKQNNKHLGDIFLKCIFFVGEQKKEKKIVDYVSLLYVVPALLNVYQILNYNELF